MRHFDVRLPLVNQSSGHPSRIDMMAVDSRGEAARVVIGTGGTEIG
jgi:hypothetical protein